MPPGELNESTWPATPIAIRTAVSAYAWHVDIAVERNLSGDVVEYDVQQPGLAQLISAQPSVNV